MLCKVIRQFTEFKSQHRADQDITLDYPRAAGNVSPEKRGPRSRFAPGPLVFAALGRTSQSERKAQLQFNFPVACCATATAKTTTAARAATHAATTAGRREGLAKKRRIQRAHR